MLLHSVVLHYFLSQSQAGIASLHAARHLSISSFRNSRTELRISWPVLGANASATAEPKTIPPSTEKIHKVVFFIVVVFKLLILYYLNLSRCKTQAKKWAPIHFWAPTFIANFSKIVYQVTDWVYVTPNWSVTRTSPERTPAVGFTR